MELLLVAAPLHRSPLQTCQIAVPADEFLQGHQEQLKQDGRAVAYFKQACSGREPACWTQLQITAAQPVDSTQHETTLYMTAADVAQAS